MIRVVLWPLLCGIFLLASAADPLVGMEQAFAKIPPRAQQVIEISTESAAVAATTFDPAAAEDFKKKYVKLQAAETEITSEISNLAGLADQIKNLYQQTTEKKGEEVKKVQLLEVQVNKLSGDVKSVTDYLARLDRDLGQADRDLAEATRKLQEAEAKRKRRRRRWRWFPPVNWIIRLVEHLKKEVPKRRNLRNSVANTRNRVATQKSATIQQHGQFRIKLATAQQNLRNNNRLLARINNLLNRGDISKQQLVEMRLYMGRLHPHMQVISEHLAEIERLGKKTPEEYMTILKESLLALQQFNIAQHGELTKFQQIAG